MYKPSEYAFALWGLNVTGSSAVIFIIRPGLTVRDASQLYTVTWKKTILKQNPNIPENFVKLDSVFQNLDHSTCSKLKLWRPSLNPLN